ncbi:protein kinase [Candidatus Uabimicrobium sp. HlEnr_7]|uniref:serine/threonine protein kinase n=1 Tax=Candidatus Uabimicrobium helgolandensis TaxID=3095367 RepID=UPI003555C572
MHSKYDLLLGKVAIATKTLSKQDLRLCLEAQEHQGTHLGIVMLKKKFVNEQNLEKLIKQQQKKINVTQSREKGEDLVMCRLLLRKNLVEVERLEKYVRKQQQYRDRGTSTSLIELLLNNQEMSLVKLLETYHSISSETLACPGCQKNFRLMHLGPGKKVRCKHCKTVFGAPTIEQEISACKRGQEISQAVIEKEIFGNYELLEQIAEGGMGIVYRGQKKSTGQIVAIKVLGEGHRTSREAQERFAREARTLEMLKHPNIVSILEVGIENEIPYFCMDFIEGEALSDIISRGPLEIDRAVSIVKDICGGLEYAHKLGVVHRDIKSSNILINKDGTPKITDFGLAKCMDSITVITRTGSLLGTPSYMSPEQAKGQLGRIGPRSDIYSLGVVFYKMLTGKNPFEGDSTVEIYQNILTVDPPPPSSDRPEISKKIDQICMKCLKKDAFQRFKTADSLAKELFKMDEKQSMWQIFTNLFKGKKRDQ